MPIKKALIAVGLAVIIFFGIRLMNKGETVDEQCFCLIASILIQIIGGIAWYFAIDKIWIANGWEEEEDTRQNQPAERNIVIRTGHDYERYVASRLKQMGYHSIVVTKGSGDHGADIIAYAPDGVKCAIQCKYYSKPVSNKAVQEALAGSHYYGCARAIVITNSRFTKQAIEDARRIGVQLMGGFR